MIDTYADAASELRAEKLIKQIAAKGNIMGKQLKQIAILAGCYSIGTLLDWNSGERGKWGSTTMVRWVDNLLLLLLLLFICNTSQGGDSAAYKKQLEAFCTSSCEHLQNRIASNSNGEDAQKKPFPTVDIFYLFSLQESKAEYLNRRYFWLLPIVAQLLSRLDKNANRSDTRIHIVTDSDVLLQEAANAGFHPYDIRTYRALNQEFIHLVTKSTSSLEVYKCILVYISVY